MNLLKFNEEKMAEKEGVKKISIHFESKEDFNTIFIFIWEHLNDQTIKTKGKVNITSLD